MMEGLLDRYQHEMAGKKFVPPENRKTPMKQKIQDWAERRVSTMLDAEKAVEVVDKGWRNIAWRKARNTYRLGLEVLQLALKRENPDEACLGRDMDRVHTFYKEQIEDQPELSVHTRRTFEQLYKIAHQSLDVRREAQRNKAEAIANIGSIVTATAAWSGFAFLHLPYAPLAFTVFTASLAGRFAVKTLIKGDGYGERELLRDSYLAAVDGATLSLGKYVKSMRVLRFLGFGRSALSTAMKFGMKKGLYHFGNTSLTSALLDSKESGHARKQMEVKHQKFLDEYEQIIHGEVRRIVEQNTWVDQARDLRPVFKRLGRKLAGA
jgi:hypothetical protein